MTFVKVVFANMVYKENTVFSQQAGKETEMATSMNEFHMEKGDALFIEGTSLMFFSALVIISVLVAWAVGGSEFKDSFFGDVALGFAGMGFIAGAIFDHFAQKRRHAK